VHGPLPASFRPHLEGPEMGKEMRNRPIGMGSPWVCEGWGGHVRMRGPFPTSLRVQLGGLEMGKKMEGRWMGSEIRVGKMEMRGKMR